MDNNENDYLFKILILGDSSVGKTCLLLKYVDDKFSTNHMPTIGIDFRSKQIEIENKKIKVQLWDTAGQERFRTLTHTLYNNVLGIILCYSVDNLNSYQNIAAWMKQIKQNVSDDVSITLIGNKCDLEDREVTQQNGQELSQQFNIPFVETSAKSGDNVDQVFFDISKRILEKIKNNPSLYQQMDANSQKKTTTTLKAEVQTKKKKDSQCC